MPSTILIMVHQIHDHMHIITDSPTTLIVLVNDHMHIITDTTPTTTLTPFPAVIRRALRANELGKFVLTMSVPMAIGLVTIINWVPTAAPIMQVALVSLLIGFALIWSGILLRERMDRTSNLLEAFGIAFVLLTFFGFIAYFLPLNLFWVPLLCGILSIAVSLPAAFHSRSGGQPNNAAAPDPESPRLAV